MSNYGAARGPTRVNLKPLPTGGHLNLWQAFQQALLPIIVFLFTLGTLTCTPRFRNEPVVLLVLGVVLLALLIVPIVSFGVIAVGVLVARIRGPIRWGPVVFWSWWPFWRCTLCVLAACLGGIIGSLIWRNMLLPYHQMSRLQAYSSVSPRIVSGERIQDAGIVVFNESAGVDRTKTGCLQGKTVYCVAPVVTGGQVIYGTPATASHDMFVAGTNCCQCPGEFRCGDWNKPSGAVGAVRILDSSKIEAYRLAAERWGAMYGKAVVHPLFFEWVADPVERWAELRRRALRLGLLAVIAAPFLAYAAILLLNGTLTALLRKGTVGPLGTPAPPDGLEGDLGQRILPHMARHYANQREQQVGRMGP